MVLVAEGEIAEGAVEAATVGTENLRLKRLGLGIWLSRFHHPPAKFLDSFAAVDLFFPLSAKAGFIAISPGHGNVPSDVRPLLL